MDTKPFTTGKREANACTAQSRQDAFHARGTLRSLFSSLFWDMFLDIHPTCFFFSLELTQSPKRSGWGFQPPPTSRYPALWIFIALLLYLQI